MASSPDTVHCWMFRSTGVLTLFFLGTVRIWHSSTYRLESTLNYGMERVWCVASLRGSNNVALGYDEGSIIVKVISACPLSEDMDGGTQLFLYCSAVIFHVTSSIKLAALPSLSTRD